MDKVMHYHVLFNEGTTRAVDVEFCTAEVTLLRAWQQIEATLGGRLSYADVSVWGFRVKTTKGRVKPTEGTKARRLSVKRLRIADGLSPAIIAMMGTVPDGEIAAVAGCSVGPIRQERIRRGVAAYGNTAPYDDSTWVAPTDLPVNPLPSGRARPRVSTSRPPWCRSYLRPGSDEWHDWRAELRAHLRRSDIYSDYDNGEPTEPYPLCTTHSNTGRPLCGRRVVKCRPQS